MGTKDHRVVANLNPRGTIDRNYVGDHKTLLHTKYKSCGPHGFKEDFERVFPHYKSMETHDHQSGACLDPRGLIGRIYLGDH